MDGIEMLRRYGARSDAIALPEFDVSADVLATLRREGASGSAESVTRPLVMAAAAGWLVAVTCALYAQQLWTALNDPLGALMAPFVVALQ